MKGACSFLTGQTFKPLFYNCRHLFSLSPVGIMGNYKCFTRQGRRRWGGEGNAKGPGLGGVGGRRDKARRLRIHRTLEPHPRLCVRSDYGDYDKK